MGAVSDRLIAVAERQVGLEMPYLHTIAEASANAFAKWMLAMPAASHRKAAPREAWHLARLAATRALDCGTCVQVVVTVARKDGVPAAVLQAALDDRADALDADAQVALGFGHAVASQADDVLDWVARSEAAFGHEAHVELAVAVAMAGIFPTVKRGLGQAVACSRVAVEV